MTQRGAGANMSVDVAAGFVAVGPNSGATGYSATAGCWTGYNDAVLNVVISAADATNPRIDRIGFGIRDAAYAGATNDGNITVITGTPAGVPAAPAVPATYIAWVDLAQVAVAALATSITNANITDQRRRLSALGGITVCTSSTRPATNLWEGQILYETDTDTLQTYLGSAFAQIGPLGAWTAWTPVIRQSATAGSGGTTPAFNNRNSAYMKIGRLVHARLRADFTGAGSAAPLQHTNPVAHATLTAGTADTGYILVGNAWIYDASALGTDDELMLQPAVIPGEETVTWYYELGYGTSVVSFGPGWVTAIANGDGLNASTFYEAAS